MKILAIHTIGWWGDDTNQESAVDLWRIFRPLEELKKHTNWQIDYERTFIHGFDRFKDAKEFDEAELEEAAKFLGGYDIVFSSYHPDPTGFSLMEVVRRRYGTQFVLDVDDDMFAINPDNPYWLKVGHEETYWMQQMIRNGHWITTTTEDLAKVFRDRRELPTESVIVLPNSVGEEYTHPPYDNGDKFVIGYFGGASHYLDLNDSNAIEGIEKLMHKYKNIYFQSVGMVVDKYLPSKRKETIDGQRGRKWIKDLLPTLNFDISIAPIIDNIFNSGKSHIKWQESSMMGAPLVASALGPYRTLKDGETALLVENTQESWFNALERLYLDEKLRRTLVDNSRKEIKEKFWMPKNWVLYKEAFERVVRDGKKD